MKEFTHCLNCSKPVYEFFCPNCGQKTDTHRITIKHFFMHDLLHGFWHIDRGILFTLRETFVRPGQAALDYIGGKRIRYYNVFYLLLIVLGTNVLVDHYIGILAPDRIDYSEPGGKIDLFVSQYMKFFIFGVVPLFALNSKIIFKRLGLNYAENLIIGGIMVLGMTLLNLPWYLFFAIDSLTTTPIMGFISNMVVLLLLLFPVYVLYDATKNVYKLWAFSIRILAFYMFVILEAILVSLLLILIVTDGTMDLTKI